MYTEYVQNTVISHASSRSPCLGYSHSLLMSPLPLSLSDYLWNFYSTSCYLHRFWYCLIYGKISVKLNKSHWLRSLVIWLLSHRSLCQYSRSSIIDWSCRYRFSIRLGSRLECWLSTNPTIPLASGRSDFVQKWVRLAPNRTHAGLVQIAEPKCTGFWSEIPMSVRLAWSRTHWHEGLFSDRRAKMYWFLIW